MEGDIQLCSVCEFMVSGCCHCHELFLQCIVFFFFFNDTATTEIYTLSLHDALPIYGAEGQTSAKVSTSVLLNDIFHNFVIFEVLLVL